MAQAATRRRVQSARTRPTGGTRVADVRTDTTAVSGPCAAGRGRTRSRGAAAAAVPVAAAPAVRRVARDATASRSVHTSSTPGPGVLHRHLWEIPVISPASPLHSGHALAYSAACVSASALRVASPEPGRSGAVGDDVCDGGASACTLRFGALRYIRVIPCLKVCSVRFARAPDTARLVGRGSGQKPIHRETRGAPQVHPTDGAQESHSSRRVRRRKGTDTW
jgi:hypothetical protein